MGVAACGVDDADDVCGGVVDPPFWIGDVLPLVARCSAKFVYCNFGEIGDRGATARTLSGESGVRPEKKKKQQQQHVFRVKNELFFESIFFFFFIKIKCLYNLNIVHVTEA